MKLTDLLVKRNVDQFKNDQGISLGFDPVEALGIKLESGLSGLELNEVDALMRPMQVREPQVDYGCGG